jgi:hypothetical protein
MARSSSTIFDMPKKPRDSGKPKGRVKSYTVFLRINDELGEAFEEYLKATRPAPTMTSAFEVALEEFLQARGFWPRKQ